MPGNGDLDFYILKLCSGRTAFEALPKKGVRFRQRELAEKLRVKGYIVEEYGSILIARREFETTIFPSGRLLMKCESEEHAREVAMDIGKIILGMSSCK
ncbi:MAG: hypothetical protein QW115_04685 [Thermoplasmata archaeon]